MKYEKCSFKTMRGFSVISRNPSKVYNSDDTALLVDNIIYEIEGLLGLPANFLVHFGKNKQKHAWFLSFTTNKIVKIKKIIITFHVL